MNERYHTACRYTGRWYVTVYEWEVPHSMQVYWPMICDCLWMRGTTQHAGILADDMWLFMNERYHTACRYTGWWYVTVYKWEVPHCMQVYWPMICDCLWMSGTTLHAGILADDMWLFINERYLTACRYTGRWYVTVYEWEVPHSMQVYWPMICDCLWMRGTTQHAGILADDMWLFMNERYHTACRYTGRWYVTVYEWAVPHCMQVYWPMICDCLWMRGTTQHAGILADDMWLFMNERYHTACRYTGRWYVTVYEWEVPHCMQVYWPMICDCLWMRGTTQHAGILADDMWLFMNERYHTACRYTGRWYVTVYEWAVPHCMQVCTGRWYVTVYEWAVPHCMQVYWPMICDCLWMRGTTQHAGILADDMWLFMNERYHTACRYVLAERFEMCVCYFFKDTLLWSSVGFYLVWCNLYRIFTIILLVVSINVIKNLLIA